MDPDEKLRLARFAAKNLGKALDKDYPDPYMPERVGNIESAATDLLEYFEAIDAWLAKGGFLPKRWAWANKRRGEVNDDIEEDE